MQLNMASKVVEFYRGKTIFITGGTGFLGIALIEKILRTCPDVSVFDIPPRFLNFKQISKKKSGQNSLSSDAPQKGEDY